MDGFTDRALAVLTIIAVIFLLHWGAPFFIPLFLALIIAYALSPVVDLLTRFLRYRVLAASIVVLTALGLIGAGLWSWKDDAERLWQQVPVAARAIADSFKELARTPSSPVAEVKKAAAEIEAIASTGKSAPRQVAAPAPAPSTNSFWGVVWEAARAC